MSIVRPLFLIIGLLLAPAPEGQERMNISLTTESDRLRFSTAGNALEWRLEVSKPEGDPVFDSGIVNGAALDWPLVDGQGQPIEAGLYRYTLTIRIDAANVRVERGQLQVERTRSVYRIAAVESDSAGSAGGGVVLSVRDAGDPPASGATAATPASRVATERTAAGPEPIRPNLGSLSFGDLISGSGTTFSMTKWIDGPGGVVGDTNVTEQNGAVVIGNGSFKGNLHVFSGGPADDVFAGMGPNLITGPGFNYGYAGSSFGRSAGFFNVRPDVSAVAPNPSLRFMTANVERMIVTNTGAVGVGTNAPTARLEVVTDASVAEHSFRMTRYGAVDGAIVVGRRARGTIAAPAAVALGDQLLFVGARGYDGNGFSGTSSAAMEIFSTENWTDTAHGAEIRFSNIPNGTAGIRFERMRINHDGTIGIGTTAVLSERLHVFGNIRVGTAGTNGCLQRFDGTALAGVCASDQRFKRDITAFPNLLDKVAQLRPVHYYWRTSEFPQRQFGTTQSYGLIAQEVEEILPELVTTDDQGYKQVDYSKLPLLTLQAVRELKAENDALKRQLQQQLQQQAERLAALENLLAAVKKN